MARWGKLNRVEEMLDRLEEARRWYLEAVDALGDDEWRKGSLCAGWTAANVVAHVAGGDKYFRALIYDATGRDPSLLAGLPSDIGERAKVAQALAAEEPARLRETAHRESAETGSALRGIVQEAPQTKLRMPFGEVPLANAVSIRTLEYVIHGYDLEPATGRPKAVPVWFVEMALPRAAQMMTRTHQRSAHKGKTASFHLHRTDGEGEWILRAEGGEARSEPGHDHADVAFRGPAAGLYWVLMGRGRPEEHGVEVQGDFTLAAAFKDWFPGP